MLSRDPQVAAVQVLRRCPGCGGRRNGAHGRRAGGGGWENRAATRGEDARKSRDQSERREGSREDRRQRDTREAADRRGVRGGLHQGRVGTPERRDGRERARDGPGARRTTRVRVEGGGARVRRSQALARGTGQGQGARVRVQVPGPGGQELQQGRAAARAFSAGYPRERRQGERRSADLRGSDAAG